MIKVQFTHWGKIKKQNWREETFYREAFLNVTPAQ